MRRGRLVSKSISIEPILIALIKYAVDSFNQNVNRFNAMNDTLKATVAGYNRDVDAYNAELSRVGTLIH